MWPFCNFYLSTICKLFLHNGYLIIKLCNLYRRFPLTDSLNETVSFVCSILASAKYSIKHGLPLALTEQCWVYCSTASGWQLLCLSHFPCPAVQEFEPLTLWSRGHFCNHLATVLHKCLYSVLMFVLNVLLKYSVACWTLTTQTKVAIEFNKL